MSAKNKTYDRKYDRNQLILTGIQLQAYVFKGLREYTGTTEWTRTTDPHHVKVVL